MARRILLRALLGAAVVAAVAGGLAWLNPRPAEYPVRAGLLAGGIPFIQGGAGPKHAVVFFGGNALLKPLHRSSDPGRYARQVGALLPEGYRFTILGYREDPPEGHGLDAIVRDFADVMRREIGRPDLVMGISFGGFVAQRFAAEHPDLVDQLVLLISGHRFSAAGRERMDRQFAFLEAGDVRGLVGDNALLFRRPWYNWLVSLKLWIEGGRVASEATDPAVMLRSYRTLFGEDLGRNRDFTGRIAAPTLVVGGTADQFFDVHTFQETADLLRDGHLVLFTDETHMLPIERSRDVADAIAGFLRETGPRNRGGTPVPALLEAGAPRPLRGMRP